MVDVYEEAWMGIDFHYFVEWYSHAEFFKRGVIGEDASGFYGTLHLTSALVASEDQDSLLQPRREPGVTLPLKGCVTWHSVENPLNEQCMVEEVRGAWTASKRLLVMQSLGHAGLAAYEYEVTLNHECTSGEGVTRPLNRPENGWKPLFRCVALPVLQRETPDTIAHRDSLRPLYE
jgi:hypothetical protein